MFNTMLLFVVLYSRLHFLHTEQIGSPEFLHTEQIVSSEFLHTEQIGSPEFLHTEQHSWASLLLKVTSVKR